MKSLISKNNIIGSMIVGSIGTILLFVVFVLKLNGVLNVKIDDCDKIEGQIKVIEIVQKLGPVDDEGGQTISDNLNIILNKSSMQFVLSHPYRNKFDLVKSMLNESDSVVIFFRKEKGIYQIYQIDKGEESIFSFDSIKLNWYISTFQHLFASFVFLGIFIWGFKNRKSLTSSKRLY